jgi:membrane protein YdbS with pleckstrin-like domain
MQTEFTNQVVELIDLPTTKDVHYQPLEASYLTTERIGFGIVMLLIAVVAGLAFFFIEDIQRFWIISGVSLAYLLLGTLYWVAETWSFQNSGYVIREHDLLFKSGWWVRSVRVVPFNRVQHLSVEVGMIERYFGLASVHIYTAGAAQADFSLYGIRAETARQIKEFISAKLQHTPSLPTEPETEIETDADITE